jgi:hypothetical protein
MPNPWDRQPRESVWLTEPGRLPCPSCESDTDSLKQYRYFSWVVCYLVGATYKMAFYRACPACMRKWIARRAAWNLITANVLWFALVLPWGLGLIIATFRKGHSRDVIRNIGPEEAAYREAERITAQNEVSWGRVWLIVAVLFCWAPLFGIMLAIIAVVTNRESADWKRPVAIVMLVISVLLHVGMAVLIALG